MNMRKKEQYLLSAIAPKTEEVTKPETVEKKKRSRRGKRLSEVNAQMAAYTTTSMPRIFSIRF